MRSKGSSFVKQAAILAMAGLVARFIGFLYRLPLTDMIGDEGNGIYGKGYIIYTFLLILSSASLPVAIAKMVSERRAAKDYANAHRIFKISLAVSIFMGSMAALVLGFGAQWLADAVDTPSSKYTMITLAPTVLIVAIMSVFRGYFQGMKNTLPTAISQVIEQVFNAVFSIFLAYVLLKYGVAMGAAGGTAGTGIGALAGLLCMLGIYALLKPILMKKINYSAKTSVPESPRSIIKELFYTSIPIITGTAIFSMTNIIDMKMVSARLIATNAFTLQEIDAMFGQLNGKYVMLTTLPVSIAGALATAVMPNIAETRIKGNKRELDRKINLTIKLTMLISIPAAVGLGVLSDQIIQLLFPNHRDGVLLLTVGSISIVFLALTQIVTGILQGMDMVKVPAIAALCGSLIKIPINYVLIGNPNINVVGAVIGTIACYLVASAINLGVLVKTAKVRLDFSDLFIKPTLASIVMGLCCFVFYYVAYYISADNTRACAISIVSGMIVYFIYILLLKGITESDLKLIPFGRKIARICKAFKLLG